MKDIEENLDKHFRLSMQRALWQEVGPNLRGITYSINSKKQDIKVIFFFDGEPSIDDVESMRCSETEVMADFDSTWFIKFEDLRVDYPAKMNMLDGWIFLRREK